MSLLTICLLPAQENVLKAVIILNLMIQSGVNIFGRRFLGIKNACLTALTVQITITIQWDVWNAVGVIKLKKINIRVIIANGNRGKGFL